MENDSKNKNLMLTQRQKEVAFLLCQGLSAKESGVVLQLKQKTVEKHIEHIKKKVGFNKKLKLAKELEKYFL